VRNVVIRLPIQAVEARCRERDGSISLLILKRRVLNGPSIGRVESSEVEFGLIEPYEESTRLGKCRQVECELCRLHLVWRILRLDATIYGPKRLRTEVHAAREAIVD
jgi:hypothetical protein